MFTDFDLALDEARSTRSYDPFGRLSLALTPISKAQVSPYVGKEIPRWRELGLDPDKIYQLLRPPAELQQAAASFNKLPILSKHTPVSADKHRRDLTIGTTGDQARYQHPYLMNTLSLWDGEDDAIGGVEDNTKRQLSAGYGYDAVMRNIRGNHVITTKMGRAGSDVVIGDEMPIGMQTKGNPPMTTLSPVAFKVRKACVTALKPAMAMDAVVDITPAFADIQQLDQRSRQVLEQRLCKIVNGKIKPSLAMDDVSAGLRALLGALGGAGPPAAQDAPLETDVGGMPTSMREQDVPTDNVEGAGLPSGALQAGGPGEGQDAPPMP